MKPSRRERDMSFIFASAVYALELCFSYLMGGRGEESALRLNKRTRDCFPQRRVRREGGLSQGTFYKTILPTGDN